MLVEDGIFAALAVVCAVTCWKGLRAMASGVRFLREVKAALKRNRAGPSGEKAAAKTAVILPCCGIDEGLNSTVHRLGRQDHGNYEVLFTVESEQDPAYAAIEGWTKDWTVPHRRVVAGQATQSSQKIHNQLAALKQVGDDVEVLAFLDSDAVPDASWLRLLVEPLADGRVGAATGFRWYSAAGGLANGVRSMWNAGSMALMETPATRFCWGGATAITRKRFAELDVAERWSRGLADDLLLTQAVRDAGLEIRFVPHALIPSHDRATLASFWEFAVRQLIITRICAPKIWRSGLVFCTSLVIGGTVAAVAGLGSALGWFGAPWVTAYFLVAWGVIVFASTLRAWLRQRAVRHILRPPNVSWRDLLWDVGGAPTSGLLHLAIIFASMRRRTIRWRHIVYEMQSASETRVLRRLDRSPAGGASGS